MTNNATAHRTATTGRRCPGTRRTMAQAGRQEPVERNDYYELPGCIEEAIMKMRAAPAVC